MICCAIIFLKYIFNLWRRISSHSKTKGLCEVELQVWLQSLTFVKSKVIGFKSRIVLESTPLDVLELFITLDKEQLFRTEITEV